jgi:hypothetical protein
MDRHLLTHKLVNQEKGKFLDMRVKLEAYIMQFKKTTNLEEDKNNTRKFRIKTFLLLQQVFYEIKKIREGNNS